MSELRRILRVFLASPGDLQDERRAVHDAVAEFNISLAEHFGCQIQLDGWEDTIAGSGRPQSLINQEVDQCDLFIGMIWKKWGTPPAHDGKFTSGFEEEFERVRIRHRETQSPEISLFLKHIPDQFTDDPGDDLKKVLSFRSKLIQEKEFLFQEFFDAQNMAAWTRKCLISYVIRNRLEASPSDPDEQPNTSIDSVSVIDDTEQKRAENSPLSARGFTFLETLISKLGQESGIERITASDIARFRLLANSISKPGNQDKSMGAHDINILYSAWLNGMDLSKHEIMFLVRLGFQNLRNENAPLWCWYGSLSTAAQHAVVFSSFLGFNEQEKLGAIRVLEALRLKLTPVISQALRDNVVSSWFSENASAHLRIAGLRYLRIMGTETDYAIAEKERAKGDHETTQSALECMIALLLRAGRTSVAQELALGAQFESLSSDVLAPLLETFESLSTVTLLAALKHRNASVRLNALQLLHERGALLEEGVETLLSDNDALVRQAAIVILGRRGRSFSEDEIKEILVQSHRQVSPGLSMFAVSAQSSRMGETLFSKHQREALRKCSESALTTMLEDGLIHSNPAYFARAEKYFVRYGKELRYHVDDTFASYYEEINHRIRSALKHISIGMEPTENDEYLNDYIRKKLTREGLNVLCRSSEPEDLGRIRTHLRSRYVAASTVDAAYLRKHGEWSDICLLTSAEPPARGGLLGGWPEFEEFQIAVSKAILRMARGYSVSKLFVLEMPAGVLRGTVELCPQSRFAKISDEVLFKLLDHDSTDVRKASAVKAVLTFSMTRIKSIAREYLERHRYYNVIH